MQRLNMESVQFFVFVFLWMAQEQVFACPTSCSCNDTRQEGILVECSQRKLLEMPSPLPITTTRLILANNSLHDLPWNELALLHDLLYVDLRGNPMECKCDYLEFWHQNVKPDAAYNISVKGSCVLPTGANSSLEGIDTGAFINCHSSVVSPTPTEASAVTKSTQIIRPSPTVMAVVSSSVAVPTSPPNFPKIEHFNGNQRVAVGTEVRVTCRAVGSPRPYVTLSVHGPSRSFSDLQEGFVHSTYGEVEIPFRAEGRSEVRCVAKNNHGQVKQKATIVVQQTGVDYMMLKVKIIEEEFDGNILDKKSTEFRDLAKRIRRAVASVLATLPGFISATLVNTRPSGLAVRADILIKTVDTDQDEVDNLISEELKKARLESLKVDRYDHSLVKMTSVKPCVAEFVNVTWSETLVGETDYQKCPHAAEGIAKRNCSSDETWYYPDYTECKTAPFNEVKKEMLSSVSRTAQIKQNTADERVLSVMRKLLNLTSCPRGEAMLAGDLITCTDIIELLVNYITKQRGGVAHSVEEVKMTLRLASCLLHPDNEQEFIVAQKVVQTASRLVKNLEIYGMQAVPLVEYNIHGDFTAYIFENVVLGTGIVRPDNVSHDVVFPDYNRLELDAVRQRWHTSSLVVVDAELIKSMANETKEIKMLGLLYRTLTRILSAESAYSEVGLNFDVNSAVVSTDMDPMPKTFIKPIIIASEFINVIDLNGTPPICAYWDFNINAPHGGWSKVGCYLSTYNMYKTVCHCNHMTNFGVLTEKPVALLPAKAKALVYCAYCSCLVMALWIIIAWCALTLLVLLIFFTCLKPDRTWAMHMCVCASLIVTFALLLVGLNSYNNLPFCKLLSFLAHYFFLCPFSWILTEGVYMLTWGTTAGPKKANWIGYFFLGWGLPGIPMLVTWWINDVTGFESPFACWMTVFSPMIWVFFLPALVITLICFVIYQRVWKMATGHKKVPLKGIYWQTRFRVHVIYSLVLILMFLVLWLLGVLLLSYPARGLFCILFTVWCFITGFLVFWFYCVMDRQLRDAFRSCCCYYRRGRYGIYDVHDVPTDGNITPDEMSGRTSLIVHHADSLQESSSVELGSMDKIAEIREPLLTPNARDEDITTDDPLYHHITLTKLQMAREMWAPELPKEMEEPVYAQVDKQKKQGSDDDLHSTPVSALTRETVIKMAQKSDASKLQLAQYKSLGSDDQLSERYRSTYVINPNEMDAELAHFRSRSTDGIAGQLPDTSTPADTPRSEVPVTNVYQTFVTVTRPEIPERTQMQPVEVKITPSPQTLENSAPMTPLHPGKEEYESQTLNVSFDMTPTDDFIPIVEIILTPKGQGKGVSGPHSDTDEDTSVDDPEIPGADIDGDDSFSRPTSV